MITFQLMSRPFRPALINSQIASIEPILTSIRGMVFCVESYCGAPGGAKGVKLEQQILVTPDSPELLSDMEFEERLL